MTLYNIVSPPHVSGSKAQLSRRHPGSIIGMMLFVELDRHTPSDVILLGSKVTKAIVEFLSSLITHRSNNGTIESNKLSQGCPSFLKNSARQRNETYNIWGFFSSSKGVISLSNDCSRHSVVSSHTRSMPLLAIFTRLRDDNTILRVSPRPNWPIVVPLLRIVTLLWL